MSDPISSPDHYRWLPVEVIEITEHLSFTLGNVVKYVLRADHKGKPIEDLKKARWYLDREIARREAEAAASAPRGAVYKVDGSKIHVSYGELGIEPPLAPFYTPGHEEQFIRGDE